MYFDTLTLAAIADELRDTILFGRIQRVVLPTPLSVALEVYARRQRYQLIASANPQFARIHLIQEKPSRGVEQATPFLLLMRKYALGGRITAIEQPPLERILLLRIAKEHTTNDAEEHTLSDELAAEQLKPESTAPRSSATTPRSLIECDLVVETMERRSNIILVDDNNIIFDSIKRVTPRMSRRTILPHEVYELPPAQAKHDPRTASSDEMQALASGQDELERALVKGYRGVSPQAAREAIYRVLGQTRVQVCSDLPWDDLAAALCQLFQANWQPTLAGTSDEKPIGYAPYQLTHIEGAQPQPGMSAALEAFYAAHEHVTSHRQRRDAIQQLLDGARERLQRMHDQISTELERARRLEELRWEGEMIFAFAHTLTSDQTVLEVDGKRIEIDPSKGAIASAQERFRVYNKARNSLEDLPRRLRTVATQLAGLEQLATLLELTDEREQIDQIAMEAEEQGYIIPGTISGRKGKSKDKQQRRSSKRKPLHLVSSDGFDIYVGRSANQNADVTFRIGRPEDIWLHVRSFPGAHVIVRSSGRTVPERTLQEAAGVAAYFSRVRNEATAEVDVSRRSLVRKVPGGMAGLVTYRAEQTLRVPPTPPWA